MRLLLAATALLVSAVASAIYPSCDTSYVETWPSGKTLGTAGEIRLTVPIWRLDDGSILKIYDYEECNLALVAGNVSNCLNIAATYESKSRWTFELRPERPLLGGETYRLETRVEDTFWDSARFGDHGKIEEVRWTATYAEASEIQWVDDPRIMSNNYRIVSAAHSFGPDVALTVRSRYEWHLRAEIFSAGEQVPSLVQRLSPIFWLQEGDPPPWEQADAAEPQQAEALLYVGPRLCGPMDMKPGKAYRARLTAVDIFGNESEPRELAFFTPPEDPEVPVEQQPGTSWVEEHRWPYHVATQTLLAHDSVAQVEVEPREFDRHGLRLRFKSPEAERVFLAERRAAGVDPEWISVGERHSVEMVPLRIDRGALGRHESIRGRDQTPSSLPPGSRN